MVFSNLLPYSELVFARIWWSKGGRIGWPELAGNELGAAAGARPGARGVLWCTTGASGGGIGLLGGL